VVLVGGATVFFDVAYQAYLPTVVNREHLAEGNSKLQASQSTGQALGPGIGGLVAQAIGAGNAVFVTGFGYLFSAFSLSRIKTVEPEPITSTTRNLRREIVEGLNYVIRDKYVRPVVLCSMTSSFFNSVVLATEVLFLSTQLKLSSAGVGIALAASGLGSVVGALTAGWWMAKVGQVRAIWLIPVVTWPFHLLFPLAQPGLSSFIGVAGAAIFCYGAVVYNVASVTFRQQVCPDRLLGRMNASVRFLVWGIMPIGALGGGIFAEWVGVRVALLVATVGILLGILWLLASPIRKLREIPPVAMVVFAG
jgi:predicted MFS family arabinose efflux permease